MPINLSKGTSTIHGWAQASKGNQEDAVHYGAQDADPCSGKHPEHSSSRVPSIVELLPHVLWRFYVK